MYFYEKSNSNKIFMLICNVRFQMDFLCARIWTKLTLKWFDSRMNQNMPSSVFGCFHYHRTVRACKLTRPNRNGRKNLQSKIFDLLVNDRNRSFGRSFGQIRPKRFGRIIRSTSRITESAKMRHF